MGMNSRVCTKPYGRTRPQWIEFKNAETLLEQFYADGERISNTPGLSKVVEDVRRSK